GGQGTISSGRLLAAARGFRADQERRLRRLRTMDLAAILSLRVRRSFRGRAPWAVWHRHALVEFFKDGKCFLVEPQMRVVGEKFPRLSTLRYRPRMSVAWDGTQISFYMHQDRKYDPRFAEIIALVSEWLVFWGWFWLRVLPRLPIVLYRRLRARLATNHDSPATSPNS